MNIYQILAVCGMLSPIVYTAMWIVGGNSEDYIKDQAIFEKSVEYVASLVNIELKKNN